MSGAEQSRSSVDANRRWFAENSAYAEDVSALDTYRNISAAIDQEVKGIGRMLDIGNGGVFDYETSLVREIVAVDLFLEEAPPESVPPNVTFRRGDALALDEDNETYDAVLIALVLHHLVGESVDDLVPNIRRAIGEAHRVLRPGGRLIVVESCIPAWFYPVECRLYRPLTLLASTPLLGHPATMQLPARLLGKLMSETFMAVSGRAIPVGRWILQFGQRWPTALTPARPWVLTGTRR